MLNSKRGIPIYNRTCNFTFFPNATRMPGLTPMNLLKFNFTAPVELYDFVDGISGHRMSSYKFIGIIANNSINPRLCRWKPIENENPDIFFQEVNLHSRYPLSAEYGLPNVRCMFPPEEYQKEPKTKKATPQPGAPLGAASYSKFSSRGIVTNAFSQGAINPLCGNAVNLGLGYYEFSGTVEHNVSQVLECQSGLEQHLERWKMIPLFSIRCGSNKPWPPYPWFANVSELPMGGLGGRHLGGLRGG